MKLHLPKMLTAALLAAFVTTTAQAAVTSYDVTTWDSYDSQKGAAVVGNGTAEVMDYTSYSQQFNTDWHFIVTVNADSITADKPLTLMALYMTQNSSSGLSEGVTLANSSGTTTATLTSWSNAAAGGAKTLNLTGVTDLTFVMSHASSDGALTMNVYADGDFTRTIATATQTGQKFGGTTVDYVAFGGKGGMDRLPNAANKVNFPADNTTGTIEITKAGYLLGSVITASDLGKYYSPATTLVWNGQGTTATWDTTSESWLNDGQAARYVSGLGTTANFNTGNVAKDVTVSGDIKAATVNVNDDYKFTVGSGQALTIDTLAVADGKTATMAGEGTISLSTLSGALSIDAGATVNMASTVTLSGTQTLQVSGAGTLAVTTLKVAGGTHTITSNLNVSGGGNGEGKDKNNLGINFSAANGTLNINAGTTTVTGAVYSNQNGTQLNIGTGEKEATLVTRRIELSDGGSSSLHIGAKGKVVITSDNDANGSTGAYKTTGLLLSEWVGGTTANIEGKLYAQNVSMYTGDAGMTLNINNGGVVAVKGIATNYAASGHTSSSTINLAEGGKIVLGTSGMADCTLAPWTINLNGGEIGITADATIARALNVAGDVTFKTAKYTWADSGATLNEGTEGGTLTISGNITGDGTITKTGEGTLVLSGANNVLTHTIAANAGTLTLSGGFEIGGITPTGGGISYTDGEHDGNGYETATGNIVVYSGEGAVNATGSFTYHGETAALENGVYKLTGQQVTSTYYINNNADSYSWIDEHKKAELTGGIVVAENGTLKADKEMSMSVVAASSKGTVEIAEGVVVTAAGGTQTVSLTGDGTYALASGTQSLGSVNAENFDGTVRLSGGINDINLDGNLQGLTVELNGVSNYFKNLNEGDSATFTGDIILTNAGQTAALTINNGYSRMTSTYIFSGDISGEGTWALTNGNITQHYEFRGDLSDWAGEFNIKGGRIDREEGIFNTSLTFAHADGTVGAAITCAGGYLDLNINENTTFANSVSDVTNVVVADGKTVTFNDDASMDTLSGTGTVALGEGSTLTVTGTVAEGVQIDAADGATIDASLAPTQVSIADSAHFAQGINDASGVMLSSGEGTVDVKNNGAYPTSYTISNGEMDVQADVLTLQNTATDAVTVDNALTVNSIVNDSEHELTVSNLVVDNLTAVSALSGNIDITSTQGDVVIAELNIADGKQVFIHNGPEETEVTVTVTETLAAGNGTLLADLTMMGDSKLDVAGGSVEGGLQNALTLGSTLTLDTTTGLINLDDTTLVALDALGMNERLTLVQALDETTLTYGEEYDGMWFGQLFIREGEQHSLVGDYTVFADGDGFGLVKVSETPEPTTGTLSLLALAALAARRRRK